MATLTTCPRGHALPDDAVFCAICWIRVSSDNDSTVTVRRGRRRRMLIAVPLIAAGSIAAGVAVGAIVANTPTDVATPVAAAPVAAAQVAVVASPVAEVPVDEPAVSVNLAAPLAATVPEPVEAPTDCVAAVRGEEVACTSTDGWLEFTVCVPDATTFIRVGTRPDNTVKFQDGVSEIALGGPSTCAEGINANVRIFAYSPDAMWRVVGRSAEDKKIWKSRVVANPAS